MKRTAKPVSGSFSRMVWPKKRIGALLSALALALAMSVTAYAAEVPDTSKTGSISVTMSYDGEAVPGGTLTLYKVGEIYEDNGSYCFVLTEAFARSGVSLDDLSSTELAEALADYISENSSIASTATVAIGDDGRAVAEGLTLGLYLIVQTEAAEGFEAVSPFVVSVPANEDGTYVYDVDATPKMGALTAMPDTPDTPDEPNEPDTPTTPDTPATPSSPTLPQTGQLNWPVPVLAAAGLCLILLGFALRSGRKERPYAA